MNREGFTLIEVIVVMAIVAILAGIMVPFVYRVWEGNDIELTRERMLDLKRAMVGDPRMIQNGIRTYFGYAGDNGQLPDRDTIWGVIPAYMPAGYDPNKYNKDAWGNKFVYSPSLDDDGSGRYSSATIVSLGPNGVPGPSDEHNDDIDATSDPNLQINKGEVLTTKAIQGNLNFVFTNATVLPVTPEYSALIAATYAGGSGTTGCIILNVGQINPGESKSVSQNFSRNFLSKLPIGKSVFVSTLYPNNSCAGSGTSSANNMAVFISDGLNVIFVNLPTINYTVTGP